MYNQKKILAIIPARGGSKSIPNKNMAPLSGRPLISYSIAQARQARYVDRVVVSSDSPVILAVAARAGIEAVRRPKPLAQDKSKMDGAMRHVLLYLRDKDNFRPDFVVLLQPTSPLRKAITIDKAIAAFVDKAEKFDSLAGMCALEPKVGHIKNGRYTPTNSMNMQRQELKPLYKECGTIFVFKPSRILKKQPLYGKKIMPFIITNRVEALDINDQYDLDLANYFLNSKI